MTTSRPDWRFLLAHPAHLVAMGFGAGLARWAPGTVGTLVAFPFYGLLSLSDSALAYGLAVVMALGLGVWACGATSRALGVHDHPSIVWDEIVAFLLVLPFAPRSVSGLALAFGLFRLFDICKPFPIRWLDARVPGGLGIMLDDVAAASYAVLCLMGVRAWM